MNPVKRSMTAAKAVVASIAVMLIAFSFGAAQASEGHSSDDEIGMSGDASEATETVHVDMYDNYYEPEELSFQEGQTVRFVITNKGDAVHEFNIGTAEMHLAHQPEMEMMVEHGVIDFDRIDHAAAEAMQASMGHGMHEEPNSVLLEPGQTAEIVWTFPDHAELEFACNVPGHYGSGMVGEISLTH
ncbi:MAG: cupredoxin domain-containing protein [Alphaproteobacteria bacterium]